MSDLQRHFVSAGHLKALKADAARVDRFTKGRTSLKSDAVDLGKAESVASTIVTAVSVAMCGQKSNSFASGVEALTAVTKALRTVMPQEVGPDQVVRPVEEIPEDQIREAQSK